MSRTAILSLFQKNDKEKKELRRYKQLSSQMEVFLLPWMLYIVHREPHRNTII